MNINFEWYRVFVCVAECGNITAAAERLYISQPAVSQIIHQLEDALHCDLFLRTPRGVRLTAEGETLLRYAAQGVAAFAEGERQLADLCRLEAGEIRIGGNDLTLEFCLLPCLERYRKLYPNVKLHIISGTAPQNLSLLRENRLDFAAITEPLPYPDLEITPIREFRDIFVCAPDYEVPADVCIADLQDELIMLTSNTNTRVFLGSEFARRGISPVPKLEIPSSEGIVRFAARGMGIGCVVADFAESAIAAGRLRKLQVRDPLPPRHICIARSGEIRSKAADELLNMILQGV